MAIVPEKEFPCTSPAANKLALFIPARVQLLVPSGIRPARNGRFPLPY